MGTVLLVVTDGVEFLGPIRLRQISFAGDQVLLHYHPEAVHQVLTAAGDRPAAVHALGWRLAGMTKPRLLRGGAAYGSKALVIALSRSRPRLP